MANERSFNLVIIANWAQGNAISGGDRIFIELAKRWIKEPVTKISLFTSEEGYRMCQSNLLKGCSYTIWSSSKNWGMFTNFLVRTLESVRGALKYCPDKETIIYSASDFWPDSIPAFIIKLRNKDVKWIAGFYLFAPVPWGKDSPYKGKRWFTGLVYWLTQRPCYWIVKRYADMVFVTSEPDVGKFITKKRDAGRIVVIRGGVDTKLSNDYLNSYKKIPFPKRTYDACFIGRFHPQKGVLELIDVWKIVCQKRPKARLALIGTGPLESEIEEKVRKLNLENNIELLGFRDGEEKYEVFKDCRTVVHPAIYDSGGMAACEAMAWGLPGVSFDLEALKTYYSKGMLKTPCFEMEEFARNILRLLDGDELYDSYSRDALGWAREWDWEVRAKEILEQVKSVCL